MSLLSQKPSLVINLLLLFLQRAEPPFYRRVTCNYVLRMIAIGTPSACTANKWLFMTAMIRCCFISNQSSWKRERLSHFFSPLFLSFCPVSSKNDWNGSINYESLKKKYQIFFSIPVISFIRSLTNCEP